MSRPRLNNLDDLLACPVCHHRLSRSADGLHCSYCPRRYPVIDGVPVLLASGAALPPDRALPERTEYDPGIARTVLESLGADAVVLEIGAGNMASSRSNVIRMDVTLTPHVDVVGDAHALPFLSDQFDYVFSLAVLEHLRGPFAAAAEMHRVLRRGGYLYAECAFVFPFHGHPNHYFNASHLGMAALFEELTELRSGVGPHQMPSFAMRALLETYLFFVAPHSDPAAQRVTERVRAVLAEDLAAVDQRFSQEAALRCAACTYFFGVKQPHLTEVIPAVLLRAHDESAELQERFLNPLDLSSPDNLLTWGRDGDGRRDRAVAAHFDGVATFDKAAPHPVPKAVRVGIGSRFASRCQRATVALRGQWRRSGRRWSVEDIIDDGERVTHLFPNDCYIAHLSIYRFAVPFIDGGIVLDAGCGAGYGAAYLAKRGAGRVLGIDASANAIAFSRSHFACPNLQYEIRNLLQLDELEPRTWDVVMCSNVLEHVGDVGRFLRGVAALLAPSGVLVVAVPPIVNSSLREQNLANPYHLNIWSPRQWAHVLAEYFADVETFQHWYDRTDVELNLVNAPDQTVITEDDFYFRAATPDALYELPTLTAIFTARQPLPPNRLPRPGAPLAFVDDSFTRPGTIPPMPPSRWQRALYALGY